MLSLSRITLYAIVAVGLFLLVGASVDRAYAAPLTYNANTIVQTTSPASTLTILSGSVADQVQVNATSVMVTMSATTGGTFSIQTASTSLTSSPSAAGLGCNGGLQTASYNTSTASTVYTVTPSGSACSDPLVATVGAAGTANTSGGGSGGGSGFTPSSPAPAAAAAAKPASQPTTTLSRKELEDKIASLKAALQVLLQKAQTLGAAKSGNVPPGQLKFQKNLNVGAVGSEIKDLQTFLISSAAGPAAKELAIYGATGYYGKVTKKALAEYQKSVGIVPPSGYFGPKTRAYLNALKL